MKNVAIVTVFDVSRDPRPKRVANCLSINNNVLLIGPGKYTVKNYDHLEIIPTDMDRLSSKLMKIYYRMFRKYESYINEKYKDYIGVFSNNRFDLIVCHDLEMLPIVLKNKKEAKVIFDAREYYPLHFEDSLRWRILNKKKNYYLCLTYLPKVEIMMSVSDGILNKYFEEFNKKGMLFESWPDYSDISPGEPKSVVKMIYHGSANSNRKLEFMIQMMDFLDNRFSLDLMLVPGNRKYFDYLVKESKKRKNVNIINPVEQDDIVGYCAKYDIGIFICPPTTFNLKYALPNKLFEYIQSRLAIAVSPSVEMVKVVKEYDVGVVAKDFTPQGMAQALKDLSVDQIRYYKNNSNRAAEMLNANTNCQKLQNIVSSLTG